MNTHLETVLIVEDDDALRRLLEHVLVFEGFNVLTAAHGAEALRALDHTVPALVVLDLVMPWVNGIEVLATMRQVPRLRSVPVLVVTGSQTTERDLAAYRPLQIMRKPLNIEAVAPAILQLLAKFAPR
jgi:CheY-like chemotaxis protein